jgi:hypothetical protein
MSELEKIEEITLTPESITLPEVTNVAETTIAEEVTNVAETTIAEEVTTEENLDNEKELTEEEKREIYIQQLKDSHIKFHPIKHNGKITINQFDSEYRKKRQRKNKMAKASRKANRK